MGTIVLVVSCVASTIGVCISTMSIAFVFDVAPLVVRAVWPAHDTFPFAVSCYVATTVQTTIAPDIGSLSVLKIIHPITPVDIAFDSGIHTISMTQTMLPCAIVNLEEERESEESRIVSAN